MTPDNNGKEKIVKINDSSNTNGKITKSNSNQRLCKVNDIEMKVHLNYTDGIEKDTSCDTNFMKNKKLMIVLLLKKTLSIKT